MHTVSASETLQSKQCKTKNRGLSEDFEHGDDDDDGDSRCTQPAIEPPVKKCKKKGKDLPSETKLFSSHIGENETQLFLETTRNCRFYIFIITAAL